jgi:hypothetical protein
LTIFGFLPKIISIIIFLLEGGQVYLCMKNKTLLKTGIVAAILAVASLVGFSAAYGYGGGGVYTPTPCSRVTYADWQGCVMGIQYRNVTGQTPANCVLTASQQTARVQSCASTPACESITYGDWSTKCVLGIYTRNIVGQSPSGCKITVAQELARAKTCKSGIVLGDKVYAEGTLLRGSDNKVYVVVGEKLKLLATLKELQKYAGKEILKVDQGFIDSLPKVAVLGQKRYGEGQLIRNGNVKVYVIIDGQKKHILNLDELTKYYFGKPIYKVTAEELEQY